MNQLVSRPQGSALVATAEEKPLVTAILVTSNKESYIRECLCGLMKQSLAGRMEVIVVDEGSEQSEWAVIADLQRSHRNLISLRVASAGGGAAGLNLALKMASGSYLTVLEATDRLKQDAYELLSAELDRNPDAMLCYGDTCFTAIPHESFASHTSYGKMIWPDYTSQQLTQLSHVAPHPMWRRELHDSVGFFREGYQSHGMRDFLLRVVERFRIAHIDEFTGLKLLPAGVPLNHDANTSENVPQGALRQPQAEPAAPRVSEPVAAPLPSEPAVSARPSADRAYAAIQALVNGEEPLLAADALVKHLASYPEHAIAHNDLAAVSFQLGDRQQAIAHYRVAVRLAPQESGYRKNLADLLFTEGQVDEAISIYLELLKQSPRDLETLLNLGIICQEVGQPTEAESFYERALEIEPWNQAVRERLTGLRRQTAQAASPVVEETAEDRYQRVQELVAQQDLDLAARELEGMLAHFPEFAPAHNDLAVLYYQNGAKDQALLHYEKAAALAPGNSVFQKNLADFYFIEGRDVDGAIAIYLEQLRKEPRNIETLMSLGKICALLDRPEEAESFYGKVTQLEPWNQSARESLSTLRRCANG